MFPPQPQASLPMPKNGTVHGSSRPFSRRSAAIGESSARVRYSIQSLISRTVPEPTLPLTYASVPSSSTKIGRASCRERGEIREGGGAGEQNRERGKRDGA